MSDPREPELLPEGVLATDRQRPDGIRQFSLTAHAIQEMARHRWIESQKAGHDCGDQADHDWLALYWKGWARSKLLEHYYGWRYWSAFGSQQYGLFNRTTVEHAVPDDVLKKVAEILAGGGENLDVIDWALSQSCSLDPILWLLDRVDINAARSRLLTDHIRLFLKPCGTPS